MLFVWGRGIPVGYFGLDDKDRLRVALVFEYHVCLILSDASSSVTDGRWVIWSSSDRSCASHALLPGVLGLGVLFHKSLLFDVLLPHSSVGS